MTTLFPDDVMSFIESRSGDLAMIDQHEQEDDQDQREIPQIPESTSSRKLSKLHERRANYKQARLLDQGASAENE